MIGKNHIITGISGWALTAPLVLPLCSVEANPKNLIAGGIICAGASVLPDIDTPNSTIAHSLGFITHIIAKIVAFISGGHRNGTHSIAGVAAFILAAWALITLQPQTTLPIIFLLTALVIKTLFKNGMFVTLFGSLIISLAIFSLAQPALWLVPVIGLGCALHIIGDMLTPQGAPLFYPIKARFKVPLIRSTGDFTEQIIVAIITIGTFLIVF